MNKEQIEIFLSKYINGADILINKYNSLKNNKNILIFRPFENAWTIKEHIIHIVDGDINAYIRLNCVLAESGKSVMLIDEEKWTENLFYHNQSVEDYLQVFELLRKIVSNKLKSIKDDVWERNHIIHPTLGKVTLFDWLRGYSTHLEEHINYIERNEKLWLENKN
ncbi:MAG: hypothetical protein A2086_09445 [Spirochaetes bacterium GWD1_27_9]|nr:MAG: hypothetical protein A2Y34_13270 [Spirochaetes bacterium GWC1_27_15]OHD29804.1 MAG: hypothetical protein A2086_09445 [Spirochaetes bacterium GWD1_27_9]